MRTSPVLFSSLAKILTLAVPALPDVGVITAQEASVDAFQSCVLVKSTVICELMPEVKI